MRHVIADTFVKVGNDSVVRPGERLPDELVGLDELIAHGSAHRSELPGAEPSGEPIRWRVDGLLEKHWGEGTDSEPYERIEFSENLLTIGGASVLWERLIAAAATAFDNTNAYIGVGDSATAAADSQTDLQAASNKLRKAQDPTYPQHTDSTSAAGAKSITYRSTFGTADANFTWAEWALFNASASGRMLNRKVEALGTKTSTATWTLTITLTLA